MTSSTSPQRGKRTALVAAAALAAGTVGAVNAAPASGLIGPAGVRAGKSITVFANIDFVAVFGYGPVGRRVTVRVVRNGVTIGSATGPTVSTPEGPALEVNHGPEGAPLPGDCWEGHTPDIQPGDHIVVTDGAGRDEVVVDDIRFTGEPVEEIPAVGDVLVPFTAIDASGVPIPVRRIDSAEFRAGSRLRFEATDIVVEPDAGGGPGEYVMRYETPFAPSRNRDELNQDQMRELLLGDGHATGFGHVAPPPREAMLVDGLADTPGPAPGCDAPSGTEGVTSVSPSVVNARTAATATVRVQGMSEDATRVQVRLSDANSRVTAPARLSADAGLQTWRASFPLADLRALSGNVRATALIDGTASTMTKTVLKDTVAPKVPRASLPSGLYRGTQRVSLSTGPGQRIRYTLGKGGQPAPTASRGKLYRGEQIRIARSRTLKAVAIDQAGNRSTVARFRYRIR